ncbi:MAG: ComEA family DNA-binding protein [Gammaproteobacteria bacterium]|nr:ComEA family DNA-binding protein [Gammaproteobacteria bacterium]
MPKIRTLLALLAIAVSSVVLAQAPASGGPPMQVNINTADAETIASVLSGVGLKKAQAIVEHRENHGRFDAATDLAKVKGIGEATVTRNEAKIVVSTEGEGHTPGKPAKSGRHE